ncbi:MAG: carboxypeptidase regulatory-like domain-containing protein, partial [Flavobacteriales bacterium]|nr:carboxypeptidase regulatory-like domain-containing protein [Flavobacteriales bacterium]
MIGETSLPADDDSVSYADMARFAQQTLERTVACGGIGYSWWQFKDVRWGRFHSDHMGLLTMEGHEDVEDHPIGVEGTPKPAAEVFRDFDPGKVTMDCRELPNQFNYSGHDRSRITGRLVDEHGHPIEGGVVLAWNRFYSHSYHTTSRADGTFELLGDMDFHHWIASA